MYKTWIKTFFAVCLTLLILIISVNMIADPMMVLPFVHKLNNRTHTHNVAHQKTNLIFFQNYYKVKDYDGIIIGSSRATAIDPNLFSPEYSVFNYAIPGSRPEEFLSYLSLAQELHGKPLRLIVIGLDFFTSSGIKTKSHVKGIPVAYTTEVKKPFYTLANLINIKAFYLSSSVLRANLHGKKPSYWERKSNSEVEYYRPPREKQEKSFNNAMDGYKYTYSNYKYNPDYKEILQEIKNAFPNAKFLVFTTPVTKPHLDMLFGYGLGASYKQWLTDIVDVFGSITHFTEESEITVNWQKYFLDSNHLYPRETDLLIKRLLNKEDENLPKDFGTVLTKDNLKDYLDHINK